MRVLYARGMTRAWLALPAWERDPVARLEAEARAQVVLGLVQQMEQIRHSSELLSILSCVRRRKEQPVTE